MGLRKGGSSDKGLQSVSPPGSLYRANHSEKQVAAVGFAASICSNINNCSVALAALLAKNICHCTDAGDTSSFAGTFLLALAGVIIIIIIIIIIVAIAVGFTV